MEMVRKSYVSNTVPGLVDRPKSLRLGRNRKADLQQLVELKNRSLLTEFES
jgi:hypothetical protein